MNMLGFNGRIRDILKPEKLSGGCDKLLERFVA